MSEGKTTIDEVEPPSAKPRLLDLSATQLIAGALAAMTSAVIGAQLGVAGTILGAAVGSLVAAVATSLYTASLHHTKNKIHSAYVAKVHGDQAETTTTTTTTTSGTTAIPPDDQPTTVLPVLPVVPTPSEADLDAELAEDEESDNGRTRLRWKPILLSAAAVFALAIASITVFELITGHSLSGGQGTTISEVGPGGSDQPSAAPTGSPSPRPTAEPTTQPTSAPPTEPTAPQPSASAEPTQSPEGTDFAEPSSTSEASPDQGDEGPGGGTR